MSDVERALRPLLELAGRPVRAGISRAELLAQIDDVLAQAVGVLGASYVVMTLLDEHDHPRLAAASDDRAAAYEQAQRELGEGPGVDTLRTGRPTRLSDLAQVSDYARLSERLAAGAAGPVGGVTCSPIRLGDEVVGTFTGVTEQAHEWTATQEHATDAFADVIGLALRIGAQAPSGEGQEQEAAG